MASTLQESYDELPYPNYSFPATHPDRLATLAWLFGLDTAPVERCRVLEIGCSAGGNLIPMAATLPQSTFVGIDFSASAVRNGAADVAALQLTNIRLEHLDIRDFGDAFGTFDYIVAHGVYSWVPKDVQECLLGICSRQLAPNGVAYVSYNTLPGWHARGVVRDAMRYHARQFTDATTRVAQARAMLDFLTESLNGTSSAYGAMLLQEAQHVRQSTDAYIYHDHLEEVNDPVHFHEFIAHARRHGLRYLAEADFGSMLGKELPPQVAQMLARIAPDLLQREQLLDFLRNQTFRRTLLVHEGATLTRRLSPERVFGLRIATQSQAEKPAPDLNSPAAETFRAADGATLTVQGPLSRAAMRSLVDNAPSAIGFEELCAMASARLGSTGPATGEDRAVLASDLLHGYSVGVVELHRAASPFVIAPGAQPQASPVVRLLASRGAQVTNLRHQMARLDDETRTLLPLLTGRADRQDVATRTWPELPAEVALSLLEQALPALARNAFLVA